MRERGFRRGRPGEPAVAGRTARAPDLSPRASARLLPFVLALPLIAMAVSLGEAGRSQLAAREAGAAAAAHGIREPPPGPDARVPPAEQKPLAPPREIHPEAREAISKILSPFCPPPYLLENCPSPGAAALRDSINDMAHAGMTADSIIERVLAAHGEEYRGMPKRSGRGLLAWTIPPAVLVAGLVLVVLVLRRLKEQAPAGAQADLTDEDRERLDAALAELEEMEESE